MEMEMAQRMRETQAALWRQSGGDPQKAQQLALQSGLDPKLFGDLEKSRQEVDTKAAANTRGLLENSFFTTNDKGERVADKETASKAYAYLNRVTGGRFESLPEAERSAHLSEAMTRFGMVQGANARRSTGLLERIGVDEAPPAFGDLPTDAQLKGATLKRAGIGLDTVIGQPKRTDYRLTAGGHEMFLPGNLDQTQLRYLADRGVQLPK
jgi:hypothetical protein